MEPYFKFNQLLSGYTFQRNSLGIEQSNYVDGSVFGTKQCLVSQTCRYDRSQPIEFHSFNIKNSIFFAKHNICKADMFVFSIPQGDYTLNSEQ